MEKNVRRYDDNDDDCDEIISKNNYTKKSFYILQDLDNTRVLRVRIQFEFNLNKKLAQNFF